MPMLISLVGYWVLALPLGYGLATGAFSNKALGVYGYWLGITAGLGVVAVMVAVRLRALSGNAEKIYRMSQHGR